MTRSPPDLQEVIEKFAGLLEEAGISYMVFGGYAVILRIPYRDTFDGDFVVERVASEEVIEDFIDTVRETDEFELDESFVRDALSHGGRFSVFSESYGIHVFVWREDISEYREEESGLYVAVPELIVAEKLKLVEDGDANPEDRKDIVALLTSSVVSLDEDRLRKIADGYGVSDLLERFKERISSTEAGDYDEIGSFGPNAGSTRVEQVARMWKDEKSYKEIADELGITQSTVGVYVARARERGLIPEKHR